MREKYIVKESLTIRRTYSTLAGHAQRIIVKAINDKTHLSTKKYFENPPIIIHKNAAGNKHFHRIPHCIVNNPTSKLISP